jgi:O-Antigen ligase
MDGPRYVGFLIDQNRIRAINEFNVEMMKSAELKAPAKLRFMSSSAAQEMPNAIQRKHTLVIWTSLVGICSPAIPISLGAINVTPGRIVVILLLVPAAFGILSRGRTRVTSDFFAVAFALWILASSALNGGFRPYVGAEALEFLGSYLVGRAFIFGPSNLRIFVTALTRTITVIVALALLDTLSGRHFTLDSLSISSAESQYITANDYRLGLVRASSVFEGAEHFGAFCVAAASIFYYSERGIRRTLWIGLSFLGCLLSLSSGPFMGFGIVTALFFYDRALKQNSWRWKALVTVIVGLILMLSLVSNDPVSWLLVHMTFNPQTGFVRLGQWDATLPLIESSPLIGHGFIDFGKSVYIISVDNIWLVEALHYGLPAAILLFLTMFSPLFTRRKLTVSDPSKSNVRTGFSLAIVVMGIIGLTVHFWDAPWLFLSLCMGIRASLAEYELSRLAINSDILSR